MKNYYLELVGLRTLLQTPDEIILSENLRPFLCAPHEILDCTIRVQACDTLPSFAPGGVWHGPAYYDCVDGTSRIFHCSAPQAAAFALTELSTDGNIRIRVLPDYRSCFAGSEGIFNRIGLETMLLQHRGLMLHASLIQYKGKAIAFAGASGTGKSTQADLWKEHLGAEIVNGDRTALRNTPTGWVAYGCPYAGTSGIFKNQSAPLAALILLQKAEENVFCSLSAAEAFRMLYPEVVVHRWDKGFVEKATDLCLQMLADIPVYMLRCRPEKDAAVLVKEGLGL